jgi:hypothetical protein
VTGLLSGSVDSDSDKRVSDWLTQEMNGALLTRAFFFVHTIITSQKRSTIDFIQVCFIVWWAVERIGEVKVEHHRQDGGGAERHKFVKENRYYVDSTWSW